MTKKDPVKTSDIKKKTEFEDNFCKVYEEEEEEDIIDNQVIKINENKEKIIYAINYSSIESFIGWEFFAVGQGIGIIKDVFLVNKNGKQNMIGCVQYTDGRLNTITLSSNNKITFINKII
jgi:hypothetical protein